MHQSFSKRVFHICMIISILVLMLFVFGMVALRYEVEGETNLPFSISKIIIISNIIGEEKEDSEYNWDFSINGINDIYMSIEKNSGYNDTEVIEEIVLSNFNLLLHPNKGQMAIVKPYKEEGHLFNMSQDNIVNEVIYKAGLANNIKKSEIGNQGGILLFRYANLNIGEYKSNEGDTIKHNSSLLSKIGVSKDEIYSTLSFEMNIKLKSEKQYQASIQLKMPIEQMTDEKAGSIEITDLSNIVFKRIK